MAVRHPDQFFYRAIVQRVHFDSSATVQFIDFGNTGIFAFDDLFPLDQTDLEYPACAVKCRVSWTSHEDHTPVEPLHHPGFARAVMAGRKSVIVVDFQKAGQPDGAEGTFSEDCADLLVELPPGFTGTPICYKDVNSIKAPNGVRHVPLAGGEKAVLPVENTVAVETLAG